jgi:peptidoglycan/LPS O-acetylase OafA/YrhL
VGDRSRLLSKLSRQTSSGVFIPEIDGLRFLSIALVVLYHAPYHLSTNAPLAYWGVAIHGDFGVQMFFAISGFILSVPFAEQYLLKSRTVSLRRYFVRRLTRLEPPYLINLATWFALKWLVLGRSFVWLLPHLFASMTYSHNAIYRMPSEVNFYAWSLEVEVQFYLLAPVIAMVFRLASRRARLLVLGFAIVALSSQSLVLSPGFMKVEQLSLLGQGQWFLAGFVLADLYLVTWKKSPLPSRSWDVVGMIAWPAIFVLLNTPDFAPAIAPTRHLALPWVLLIAYVAMFRGKLLRAFVRWRPIYVIGGMCYSIYLYHGYVVVATVSLLRRFAQTGYYVVDAIFGLTVIAAAVLTFSSLMFILFEKPFMNPTWHVNSWHRLVSRRSSLAK